MLASYSALAPPVPAIAPPAPATVSLDLASAILDDDKMLGEKDDVFYFYLKNIVI